VKVDKELTYLMRRISEGERIEDPWPSIHATDIFTDEFYNRMLDNFPPKEEFEQCKDFSYERYRLPIGRDYEKYDIVWKELSEILTSPELKHYLLSQFKIPRVNLEKTCTSYPQLVRDVAGYKIYPHPDSSAKLLTFTMYMPRDKSRPDIGMWINEWGKKVDLFNRAEYTLENYPKVRQIPYIPNSCVIFPVSKYSFHSVDFCNIDDYQRKSLHNIYYYDNAVTDGWTE
tara:strand:- start:199 stop:885 length:687 start_codon:yes stop_codon:yes gene_type:complete